MAEEETSPENRRDPRFAIRVPIYVALGGEIVRKTVHLESRDVSAGGISFETSRELPLAAETQVVLAHLGEDGPPVSIRGRIVWTRAIEGAGRYRVGVQFTHYDGLSRRTSPRASRRSLPADPEGPPHGSPEKLALALLVALVLVVAVAVQAVVGWRAVLLGPRARPLKTRTFERTPERLARGRYLVEAQLGCAVCHSERDWKSPGAPPREGRRLAGVVWAGEGMPWLTAPNLTPDPETGIGRVSDDALARAIQKASAPTAAPCSRSCRGRKYRPAVRRGRGARSSSTCARCPRCATAAGTALPFPLSLIVRGAAEPLDGPVPAPRPLDAGDGAASSCCGRPPATTATPRCAAGSSSRRSTWRGRHVRDARRRRVADEPHPRLDRIAHYDEATFVQVCARASSARSPVHAVDRVPGAGGRGPARDIRLPADAAAGAPRRDERGRSRPRARCAAAATAAASATAPRRAGGSARGSSGRGTR